MRAMIGCGVVLLSALGNVTEAAGVNTAVLAENRGLSPIITTVPIIKYDAVYSVCAAMHSADQVPENIERDNWISPLQAINSYFESQGILLNRLTGIGEPEPIQLKVLKDPVHGMLISDGGASYMYHASQGYLGADQVVYEVEILGKKFKVIETVVIHNSGNLDYPTPEAVKTIEKVCPSNKDSSLDIIELPTEGFASDEELANLHSMLSFALGSEFSGNGGLLNFANLSGAAVGQTVGTTITLDTNAAGYNWFIDPTPGQNEEWLPTSNPNEWVAKASSVAEGKMDMFNTRPLWGNLKVG